MASTVLALFGPTGVGKTALALAVAGRLRARGQCPVAVSADALQVYQGLETLTGVASAADRASLEHRLVAFLPITETFSAGRFAGLAHAEIDGLLAAGATPIVVGGTGLYLRAALADLNLRPEPPPGLRAELAARLKPKAPPRCTPTSWRGLRGPPTSWPSAIRIASSAASSSSGWAS